MDDIRASLSRTKKKYKQRLAGKKRQPDGTGVDTTSSLPQSEPHVVADEGHDQEGDGADAAEEPFFSTDRPPQPGRPESMPVRGNGNGQEEGEADVGGGEISQRESYAHPDVDVAVGSGRSGELEAVSPSPPAPSIPRGGKPDST